MDDSEQGQLESPSNTDEAAIDSQREEESSNLPHEAEVTRPLLIDIHKFADHATLMTRQRMVQASEANKQKLQELLNNQGVLLESLEHENEKFSSSDCFKQMDDMMSRCKVYNAKLIKLQKTMHNISLRTNKLKRQCSKLEELKGKAMMVEEERRRKELERENLLVARPVGAEPDVHTQDYQ